MLIKKIYIFVLIFYLFLSGQKDIFANNKIKLIDGLSNSQISQYKFENEALYSINLEKKDDELFPKIDFYNNQDLKINISDFRGKIVILHFWASWCGNCINEMIDLNEFQKTLENEEISNHIKIIPLSIDDNIELARKFYNDYNINNIELFHDQSSYFFSSLGLSVVPVTFFIDKDGKFLGNIIGAYKWNENKIMINKLKKLF